MDTIKSLLKNKVEENILLLDKLYMYFDIVKKEHDRGEYDFMDKYGNINSVSNLVFMKLLKMSKFNKYPTVVSCSDYDNIKSQEYYHGFKDSNFGKNFLTDENYHYGDGYMHGFFASYEKEFAEVYTGYIGDERSGDKILDFKYSSKNGTSVKKIDEILEMVPEEYKNISDAEIREKLVAFYEFYRRLHNVMEVKCSYDEFKNEFIMNNPSTLAVYLGYDFLDDPLNYQTIFFNRSKFVVTENSMQKFGSIKGAEKGE